MPVDRQCQLVGGHAAAIVDDSNQILATLLERDIDTRGAGIDRILDQFLDRRRRALDDFARGDAIDEDRGQQADRHRKSLRLLDARHEK